MPLPPTTRAPKSGVPHLPSMPNQLPPPSKESNEAMLSKQNPFTTLPAARKVEITTAVDKLIELRPGNLSSITIHEVETLTDQLYAVIALFPQDNDWALWAIRHETSDAAKELTAAKKMQSFETEKPDYYETWGSARLGPSELKKNHLRTSVVTAWSAIARMKNMITPADPSETKQTAGISAAGYCDRSDKGEDDFLVDSMKSLFVVCDGVTGSHAGILAAQQVIRTMAEFDANAPEPDKEFTRIITKANADAWKTAGSTTMVAVLITGNTAHIANIFDSKAFLIRGDTIEPITKATKSQLGSARTLQPDAVYANKLQLAPGDRILLVTDGVDLSESNILQAALESENPISIVKKLVKISSGGDDATAVVYIHRPNTP